VYYFLLYDLFIDYGDVADGLEERVEHAALQVESRRQERRL